MRILISLSASVLVSVITSGCLHVGPESIAANRSFYNDVLIDTANQQLLKNIVRVSNEEQPSFVDITEVNATTAFQTTPMGGLTNIGAVAGYLGAASSSITYNESPVVKYVPLSGNALITQFGTPFDGSSIVALQNTNWELASILEFVVNTITPAYLDNYRAVDIWTTLDSLGALTYEVGPDPNTITISFYGDGLQKPKLLQSVDEKDRSLNCVEKNGGRHIAPKLWQEFKSLLHQEKFSKVTLVANTRVKKNDFQISTRSALGALKLANANDVLFAAPEVAKSVRDANNAADCFTGKYYFRTTDLEINNTSSISSLWEQSISNIVGNGSVEQQRERAYKLGHSRAFIIIEKSREPKIGAYVSVFHKGFYYSIDDDDRISKLNFSFLNEILTLKAAPDTSKTTQPVIPVGGGIISTRQ